MSREKDFLEAQKLYKKRIDDLEAKLEATEEQNKRVLEKLELIVSANQELEAKLEATEEQVKQHNQDKIELLEKVKEYALELFKKFCQSTEYHSNKSLVGRRFIEYYPFNDFIDNQIKILKEGK